MAATLGKLNPFRYRGYLFDEETGLYYLRSRYYNPEWGRFLNADCLLGKTGKLLSHNVFSYCRNNPISHRDTDGYESAYIVYDNRAEGKGFVKQAEWMKRSLENKGFVVKMYGFDCIMPDGTGTRTTGYIDAWNDMAVQSQIDGDVDFLYLYVHGAAGTIDCNGQRIGYDTQTKEEGGGDPVDYTFSALAMASVQISYFNACQGATPGKGGISAAQALSDRTNGKTVVAISGSGCNYESNAQGITGIPTISRNIVKYGLGALWARFVFINWTAHK